MNNVSNATEKTKRKAIGFPLRKKHPWILFAILLLIYAVATFFVIITSESEQVVFIFDQAIPIRSLTGVISSIANLCLIFLVIFFKKPGYIVSLIVLLVQFPMILGSFLIEHNLFSIAGPFVNLLILVSVTILYIYNGRLDSLQLERQEQIITDKLTGLPNRFAFSVRLNELIKKNERFAIAIMNLNNFKSINNTMGQTTGDGILVEISSRLKKAVENDTANILDYFAYNGSDEFAFIIRNYNNNEEVVQTLQYYQDVLNDKITIEGCDYFMTARIGYAEYPEDADNVDSLYACALTAKTKAKESKDKNHISRFMSDMRSDERDIVIERKIRSALEENRLFFCLQPQFDMDHHLRGFEALARIFDEDGTIVSPAEFIPVAEKVDLIDRIDQMVFKDAAVFLGELIRKTNTDIMLSINVSVRHLMKNGFLGEVREILDICGIPANKIEIEITESIMIVSVEDAIQRINKLKEMGVKIAIDDFGTGYSSLSYLSSFPADVIKVDKSFIDKMNSGSSHMQYVAAIISIGHVMNYSVIAEGVENPEQIETLRGIGCDYIQGFCWGKPMSPEEAEKLVRESVK